MNDERTISNDNFFRVLHTHAAAHHNYNFFSFPWRSIIHMISFSLIILGIYIKYFLPAAIVTLLYLFFASHEEISKHSFF